MADENVNNENINDEEVNDENLDDENEDNEDIEFASNEKPGDGSREVPLAENVTYPDPTGLNEVDIAEDPTAPELQSDGLPPETDNLNEDADKEINLQGGGKSSEKATVGPVWPIKNGYRVSQYYKKDHGGVDLNTEGKTGVPVYAYRAGVVAAVERKPHAYGDGSGYGGYGKVVVIKHSKNKYSLYAHLDSIVKGLKKGDKVAAGQQIGVAGKTGDANNRIHLHFELRPAPGIGNVPREKRINPFTRNINSEQFLK